MFLFESYSATTDKWVYSPIGSTKSLDWASSDIGNGIPYIISSSNITTGSGSLMAAFRRPKSNILSNEYTRRAKSKYQYKKYYILTIYDIC